MGGVVSTLLAGTMAAFSVDCGGGTCLYGGGKEAPLLSMERFTFAFHAVELRPSEMTAEAWIFPTVLSGNHQAVIARGSSINQDEPWWMGVLDGKPRFWSNHANSGMDRLDAPFAIPMNEWTHLAISFDGTNKRLYIDGADAVSHRGLGALVYDAAAVPVTIGSDWANVPGELFNGRVDEVSLYRRAFSSAEIFSLADAGTAGKSTAGL